MTEGDSRYGRSYERALETAARWHATQFRKETNVPYVTHLLTVSTLVWEAGGNETEAIAGLLHDAVEDGWATYGEIETEFGPAVTEIVADCTDWVPYGDAPKEPWFWRKVTYIEHLWSVAAEDRAISTMRVSGSDKLANMRSIVADLPRKGDSLWNRFKGGLGGSAWYYEHLTEAISHQIPDTMLAEELEATFEKIRAEVERVRASFEGADIHLEEAMAEARLFGFRDHGEKLGMKAVSDAYAWLAFELVRRCRNDGDPKAAVAGVLLRWFDQGSSGTVGRADLPEDLQPALDVIIAALRK